MSDFNPIISFQSLNIEAMPKCSDKIVINPIQIEFIEVKEDDTDDRGASINYVDKEGRGKVSQL